jgi:hypothetical protein
MSDDLPSLESLGLSVRARHICEARSIRTVDELCACTERDLFRVTHCGVATVREIQAQLHRLGRALAIESRPPPPTVAQMQDELSRVNAAIFSLEVERCETALRTARAVAERERQRAETALRAVRDAESDIRRLERELSRAHENAANAAEQARLSAAFQPARTVASQLDPPGLPCPPHARTRQYRNRAVVLESLVILREPLCTADAALAFGVKPAYLRELAIDGKCPVKPVYTSGGFQWPAEPLRNYLKQLAGKVRVS